MASRQLGIDCRRCGRVIPGNDRHCAYCGTRVSGNALAQLTAGAKQNKPKAAAISVLAAIVIALLIGLIVGGGGDPSARASKSSAFLPTMPPLPEATRILDPTPDFTVPPTFRPTATLFVPSPGEAITPADRDHLPFPPTKADIIEIARLGTVEIIAGAGTGTGFVVNEDGLVVTNKHVVEDDSKVQVRFESGQVYWATVFDAHPSLDLAYMNIESVGKFTPIPLGDSDTIRTGDDVIAIGFPLGSRLGREVTATPGIISAKRPDAGLLQTDASLNPGNSGGPLLDSYGCAVGVNTGGIEETEDGRTIEGINFAIPINELKKALVNMGYVPCEEPVMAAMPTATTAASDVPTAMPAPSATATPTATPIPEPSATQTPTPTSTPTHTPTPRPPPTRVPTPTPTPLPTATPTPTPLPTATPTPTPLPTATPTPTPAPIWQECGNTTFKYELKCNQNWAQTTAPNAGGRPFVYVSVKDFESAEAIPHFFERYRQDAIGIFRTYEVFELGRTEGRTIEVHGTMRNYVLMEYLLKPSPADCLYHVVDHIFRSRFYPDRDYGFIVSAGICESQLSSLSEQRKWIFESLAEYE